MSNEMIILNIFIVKYIMYREEVYKTYEYSPKNHIKMNPHASTHLSGKVVLLVPYKSYKILLFDFL